MLGVTKREMQFATLFLLAAIVGASPGYAHDNRSPFDPKAHIRGPFTLKGQGSFYINGEIVQTDAANGDIPGFFSRDGTIAVNQMYVRYQDPAKSEKNTPVVLIHGGTVSGQCYETTPDGRMGWDEYFARRGHATYVVDQVGRARSGFDVSPFNRVRLEQAPPQSQPALRVLTQDQHWTVFRFGPTFATPFPGTQYPIEDIDELAKGSSPTQNSNNLPHLSELSKQLGGAVLVSHSQSGNYPQSTVLQVGPEGISGIVNMEPGGSCGNASLTDDQIKTLAKIPQLVLFGDFIEESTSVIPNWQSTFADCQAMVGRLQAAGGDATLLHLPDIGIRGNSHMLMQDKNNLEVAEVLHRWIDRHVKKPRKPWHSAHHHKHW